jgi:hypothetical protein
MILDSPYTLVPILMRGNTPPTTRSPPHRSRPSRKTTQLKTRHSLRGRTRIRVGPVGAFEARLLENLLRLDTMITEEVAKEISDIACRGERRCVDLNWQPLG